MLLSVTACSALEFSKSFKGGVAGESPTPVNTATQPEAAGANAIPDDATATAKNLPTYLRGTTPDTNVAQAQARLFQQGLRFYLIVVSPESTDIEQSIYRDLVKRNIRATTGPDEGYDTTSLKCHPNCAFIPVHAVNEISVESWTNVLHHEQRHMVQAANNPNMARDFRDAQGRFTTYAAFLEACADDGIYVAEQIYHASERMPKLKAALGANNANLLDNACRGDTTAYRDVMQRYENQMGESGAFVKLFPPYN